MNIIYWLKKLFKKDISNQIVYYGKNIIVPNRKNYANNQTMIKKIDSYKELFINLLTNKKINLSYDLNVDNLEKEIIMYTDLLLHLIMNDENDMDLIHDKDEQDKNLDNIIKIEKLHLYFNKCYELYTNLIAEINALVEIYNEHIIKYHRNKKALEERIEKLKVSFACYFFQFQAINIELNACITKLGISTIDDKTFEKNLLERNEYLYRLTKSANLNIDFKGHSKKDIANRELEIEKWAYQNNNELDNIYYKIDNLKVNVRPSNFEETLNTIDELLAKLTIFDEFSRNKIDNDQLYKLCKLKFWIVTYYINEEDNYETFSKHYPWHTYYETFKKKKTKEYDYYKKIIMDMITELNTNINLEVCFDYEKYKAISYIKKFLKNKNNIFDPEDILKNDLKLKLLCAFNNIKAKENIISLFENNTATFLEVKNDSIIPDPTFQKRYKLTSETSLSSMFDYIDDSYWNYFLNIKYLFSLYKLTMKRTHHNGEYYLPKNYKALRDQTTNFNENINLAFSRNYKSGLNNTEWLKVDDNTPNKRLILPDDIRGWYVPINFDSKHCFYEIVLNNGIKGIDPEVIPESVKKINIPSSLEYFSDGSLFCSLDTIVFDDWQNSEILNNTESLYYFLDLIIKNKINLEEDTKEAKHQIERNNLVISMTEIRYDYHLNIQKQKSTYIYSTYDELFSLPSSIMIDDLKLKIPEIKINSDILETVLPVKEFDIILYLELKDDYIDKLVKEIQKQLKESKENNEILSRKQKK